SMAASAANISGATANNYSAQPVTTIASVTPKVMLAISNDHQYFFKAYNDYTDLDEDGTIETTYKHAFEYYGYFDPDKCYTYKSGTFGSTTLEHFEPQAFTSDRYCDTVSGDWSGNFLNWVAMTRMDIVRKIIYGGTRIVDTASATVLERAYLPTDAHSYAKYYNGGDLAKLTPFSSLKTDTTNSGDNDGIDDIDEGITFCNTSNWPLSGGTIQSTASQDIDTEPLFRVAKGNFQLWAANERYQCEWNNSHGGNRGTNSNQAATSGINADGDSPSETGDGVTLGSFGPEFHVYIRACKNGLISSTDDNENCRSYPSFSGSSDEKPGGLVQEYGENEQIHFGLMTGTYEKNISGGVLRKDVGNIASEINTTTNGTFTHDPDSNTPATGLIRTLDKFRLFGYRYGDDGAGVYFGSPSDDDCPFQLAEITEGDCNSWGNPLSEIYAEAIRYFTGLTPTSAFAATDNSFIPGLDEVTTWTDPLDTNNFCAGLSVVMMNSSNSSYDTDQTSIFSAVGTGSPSPTALTKTVGDLESITGNSYLVGKTATDTDEFCTPKTVNDLGAVAGQCPEGPTLRGGFHVAGMAHYANTEDIRPLLTGTQTVTTFAVQLATSVPKIDIPIGPAGTAQTVRMLPAYRLNSRNGGGTLVDFKIVRGHTEIDNTQVDLSGIPSGNQNYGNPTPALPTAMTGTGVYHGKFYLNWEDSEQGGDFDQDMWGIMDYVVNTNVSPATVSITSDVISTSTFREQLFGFVLTGTTKDGFHAYSGLDNAQFDDPDITLIDCNDEPGDGNCDRDDLERTETFTVGSATADLLPDPLLLAAKYGGFEDSNGNKIPDVTGEFDIRDSNGNKVVGGDGTPDTYFLVTNPAALEEALRAVFNQIVERVSSGTAAAVVASEQEGTGAVFQALYDPIKSDTGGREVEWIGTLQSLFVDPKGFVREDADGDDALDGYNVDPVVEIFFDATERRARVRRFTQTLADPFDKATATQTIVELEELKTLWNSREQLSAVTNVTTQRDALTGSPTALTSAANGRHIFTWLDADYDDTVDTGEVVDFDTVTFTSANHGWLDQTNEANADKLVNYIRGAEQTGFRNRVLDYDGDGTTEILRLGDVVNSTPTVSGAPAEAFDLISLDQSYSAFRQQYAQRRNVVYAGANDGMLHAFNGGFFDAVNNKFVTKLTSEVEHPLGAEIWAYVPKNLLGHLQWLAEDDYPHVYYMDAKPLVFDARVFTPDADHPGGWGTLLVAGMRLGGSTAATAIVLDTANDGVGGSDTNVTSPNDDVTTKSAFVVLDVTNPEKPPSVIAELSPDNLGYTTSTPAVAAIATPSGTLGTDDNKWYLLFGNGPNNLGTVEFTPDRASIFGYDLGELIAGNAAQLTTGPFVDGSGGFIEVGGGNTGRGFVGGITVTDQDLDMQAEAFYFGTIGRQLGDIGGLYRVTIAENAAVSSWASNEFELLDADRPMTATPSVTIDSKGNTWVLAGSGRLFVDADKSTTSQQALYGILDPNPLTNTSSSTKVNKNNLEDVTSYITYADGKIETDGVAGSSAGDETFEVVAARVEANNGWIFKYDTPTGSPSERSISNSTLLGGILFNTAFSPTTDLCGAEGTSRIIARGFNTGLVPKEGVFGSTPCGGSCPGGVDTAIGEFDLGAGLASSPSIHIGDQDVPGKVTVIVQQSTGAITGTEAQTLGGINSGEVSWREFIGQ
ncbi:MAG: PilC/PilY family type IV pilus protein, partial [Pseudomonadota bacterium]